MPVQVSPIDGEAVLLDVSHPMDLATYNRTVRLQHPQNHCQAISKAGAAAVRNVCTNLHFIQVGSMYMQSVKLIITGHLIMTFMTCNHAHHGMHMHCSTHCLLALHVFQQTTNADRPFGIRV